MSAVKLKLCPVGQLAVALVASTPISICVTAKGGNPYDRVAIGVIGTFGTPPDRVGAGVLIAVSAWGGSTVAGSAAFSTAVAPTISVMAGVIVEVVCCPEPL